ncbi:MAG TPA: hypothetical protein VHD76_09035 [Bryobacteraceae bacterium]|jgi:hypothetical protein|nr:hypothetical protein [Bryobacteraceae bacterium]
MANDDLGTAPAGSGWKIPALFVAVVALAGAAIYQYVQLDHLRTESANTRNALIEEIAKVREASSVTYQTNRRNVEALQRRLEEQRQLASQAAGQARQDALAKIEDTRHKLEAAQAQQQALMKSQISEVRESTDTKLTAVNTDISGVKTDVASTKTELEKTIADLKATTGDLNVQSGLIATNGKELAALKALGERNYFEFKIGKTKEPQKVGDVLVKLKKADPKKNKFTIELTADDKQVEKKDRTINEPLQFYVSKARQPYEIVVNQVSKNQIAGYLATPKVQQARN